ncbi:MAG: lipopolysaccharide heptosyltransferase family protein, partial [Dokdonella sp.]
MLLSPPIQQVEKLYPRAEIDILAWDVASTLFAERLQIRKVFTVSRRVVRYLPSTWKLLRELRGPRYDLAIDACHGSQSGRRALSLARVRY